MIDKMLTLHSELETFGADLVPADKLLELVRRCLDRFGEFRRCIEIEFKRVIRDSCGDDPAIITIRQDSQSEILFRDKEEVSLLTVGRASMPVNRQVADLADEPGNPHSPAWTRVHLLDAHGAQAFTRDNTLLPVAHVEARILQQVADGAHDSPYAVAGSANRPRTRHLDLILHLLMPDDKTMCEQQGAWVKE